MPVIKTIFTNIIIPGLTLTGGIPIDASKVTPLVPQPEVIPLDVIWRGDENNTGLTDLNGENALTLTGAAPTRLTDHLEIAATGMNGLQTPFLETTAFTLIMATRVYKPTVTFSPTRYLMGTSNNANANGEVVYFSASNGAAYLGLPSGTVVPIDQPPAAVHDQWQFLMLDYEPGLMTVSWSDGAGWLSYSAARTLINSARRLSFGNSYNALASQQGMVPFAWGGYAARKLSSGEKADLLVRGRADVLANNGITIR